MINELKHTSTMQEDLVVPSVITPHQLALWTSARPAPFTCNISPPLGKCNITNRPIKQASVQWYPDTRRWVYEWQCCQQQDSIAHTPNTSPLDCSIVLESLSGDLRKRYRFGIDFV